MEIDSVLALLRGLAASLIANWRVGLAGALAFAVALAVVGRTNSPSLLAQLIHPWRVLIAAALALPLVLILVQLGVAQWEARNYTALIAIVGLGIVLTLMQRGTTVPPGGK